MHDSTAYLFQSITIQHNVYNKPLIKIHMDT